MDNRFSVGSIKQTNFRSRMGRFCKFPLLLDGQPTGLYFHADQHKDQSLHRVSLCGSQKTVASIVKQMGVKFTKYDMTYIFGGPTMEWAGARLAQGVLPVARNPEETFLSFMAQKFDEVTSGLFHTTGFPPLSGWTTPVVAAWLIENGWPISQPCQDAWKSTYEKWKQFTTIPKPGAAQYEHIRGEVWAIEADGTRRPAYNIERIAVFPSDLYKPELFTALSSKLGLEESSPRPRLR